MLRRLRAPLAPLDLNAAAASPEASAARFSLWNMNQCNKKWRFSLWNTNSCNKKIAMSYFCLIFPNPFKEVLRIFSIQAPNIMHTIMTFARSIISLDRKVRLNPRIISRKVASRDTLVISRIDFRHDHCKWKILGKVDCCQNIHHEVFSSHLANYKILLQSGARWQIWGAERSYLHKHLFLNKFLV